MDNAISSSGEKKGWFATTLWSQVVAASDPEKTHGLLALEALCERYWYPLYAFARQKGAGHEDARDLVQGFFEQLLSRSYLTQADPDRGRFRSFLIGSFKHYTQNQRMKNQAQKRGCGQIHMSLDDPDIEDKFKAESGHDSNPERDFDRRWALSLLEGVMKDLRGEWKSQNRLSEFEQLKPHMLKEGDLEPYHEMAQRMKITEAAFKMKIKRLREQYRDLLHRKIADTVQHPSEVQEELAYLQKCLIGA
ncbi:MAG: sigma-70 family RNA polymerase sigma factor [Flavobacteriales bacterium]|jgi:RNA polymerase sigma factor (sigma-70 family)|nr:sigma-70 family RNA polymerase sigma factor [Flavobacteriales bacterium]MBT5926746.1 sigma-70 family RNA polymerase sigma factor [Verrucomicrobiota bacterium]